MIGKSFGRWRVIKKSDKPHRFICRCDCGTSKSVYKYSLLSGRSTSCGCFHREIVSSIGKNNKKHGMHNTPPYVSWKNMKSRCTNPNDKDYPRYGGRGVAVCDRWMDFSLFWNDMGVYYKHGMTIDRINNNGNYEKSNCRWANHKTQANNRRGNRIIEFNGKSKTASQWADDLGISYWTLRDRLNKRGWGIEKALTTPKMR